jgi:hypothetical protein
MKLLEIFRRTTRGSEMTFQYPQESHSRNLPFLLVTCSKIIPTVSGEIFVSSGALRSIS